MWLRGNACPYRDVISDAACTMSAFFTLSFSLSSTADVMGSLGSYLIKYETFTHVLSILLLSYSINCPKAAYWPNRAPLKSYLPYVPFTSVIEHSAIVKCEQQKSSNKDTCLCLFTPFRWTVLRQNSFLVVWNVFSIYFLYPKITIILCAPFWDLMHGFSS